MIRVDITALSCGEALPPFPSFRDSEQTVGQQASGQSAAFGLIQIKGRPLWGSSGNGECPGAAAAMGRHLTDATNYLTF
jgi:hypothetical protein